MERYPQNGHELAREVAAFGTSNPRTIWLGVTDDGRVVGIGGLDSMEGRDGMQRRIEGLCSNTASPALVARVAFEEHQGERVVAIRVPKGSQPVYYSGDKPYLRPGSLSRPARAQEVVE